MVMLKNLLDYVVFGSFLATSEEYVVAQQSRLCVRICSNMSCLNCSWLRVRNVLQLNGHFMLKYLLDYVVLESVLDYV